MRLGNLVAIGVAAAVVIIVVTVCVINWGAAGDVGIDANGWIALVLGVLATLALGIGLMALVFISNRRGYDEPPGEDH
jgi:hypothetical protein